MAERGNRAAAVLFVVLIAQGVALLGAGGFLALRAGGNDVTKRSGAVVAALLTLAAAAALLLLARALRPPGAPWAVTPALVLELLCVPVAVGLVQSGRPELGLPVGALAVVGIACLLAAGPRRG